MAEARGFTAKFGNATLGHAHDNPKVLRGLLRYLRRDLERNSLSS
jgi:hypothetical protein